MYYFVQIYLWLWVIFFTYLFFRPKISIINKKLKNIKYIEKELSKLKLKSNVSR